MGSATRPCAWGLMRRIYPSNMGRAVWSVRPVGPAVPPAVVHVSNRVRLIAGGLSAQPHC
eukprot:5569455-Prymnesium_polylepis.1